MSQRVGIFSGSFDPVHKGHIAFAKAALKSGQLDTVYFAPESHPRRKTAVTHIAHRVAMLKLALESEPNLNVLELPDKNFSVAKTVPRLKKRFPTAELYYLAGSDMLEHMPSWDLIEPMITDMGLIIGLRGSDTKSSVQKAIKSLPVPPKDLIIASTKRMISSQNIRDQVAAYKKPSEIPEAIQSYIDEHWLYHKIGD